MGAGGEAEKIFNNQYSIFKIKKSQIINHKSQIKYSPLGDGGYHGLPVPCTTQGLDHGLFFALS
jgi:hypothetical protein